ncbi:MAG: epimerase [Bacteroidetes bacterium]|nr:epimerase [Bacteroidota bacterium]
MEKLKIILTGSTGMVGEGVLHECLHSDLVSEVLVVNRKPCGYTHNKLRELILPDFFNIESIKAEFSAYNCCLFCLGVSSVGMNEADYTKMTYDLTLNFAKVLAEVNKDMTFSYISGAGTDSTEKGRMMWARVKGKTENDLKKLGFRKVYNFRPGMLKPTPGLKNTLKYYKYVGWLYPVLKLIAPGTASTLAELGQSMIRCSYYHYGSDTLEVRQINETSKLNPSEKQ